MQEKLNALPETPAKLDYATPVLRDHGLVGDLTQTNFNAPMGGSDNVFGVNYIS